MAPSSRERTRGARTRLLLLGVCRLGGDLQGSSSERPHAVTLGRDSPVWGRQDLRAEAGRQGGREGRGTAQPLLSPILVLRPASRPPAHPTRP